MISFNDFDLRTLRRLNKSYVLENHSSFNLLNELTMVLPTDNKQPTVIDLSRVNSTELRRQLAQLTEGCVLFTNISTIDPDDILFSLVRLCMKADFRRYPDMSFSEQWMNHLANQQVSFYVIIEERDDNSYIRSMVRTTGCSYMRIGDNGIIRDV